MRSPRVVGYCGGQNVLRGEDRKVVLASNGQPQVYIEAPIRCLACGPLPETRSPVFAGQPLVCAECGTVVEATEDPDVLLGGECS